MFSQKGSRLSLFLFLSFSLSFSLCLLSSFFWFFFRAFLVSRVLFLHPFCVWSHKSTFYFLRYYKKRSPFLSLSKLSRRVLPTTLSLARAPCVVVVVVVVVLESVVVLLLLLLSSIKESIHSFVETIIIRQQKSPNPATRRRISKSCALLIKKR